MAPWLEAPTQRFEARLARGQIPQAILIHGPEGVGRRKIGLQVAARLLDLHSPDALPTHPDYWVVELEEDARVIKVEQLRKLMQNLGLTSHRSGRKVGLIWPADAMNNHAANSLLKTLEEPAPDTTLVLIAASPSLLPATVVSRCERLRLSTPSLPVALAWLMDQHPDQAACARALAFSAGAPLTALALLEEEGGGRSKLLQQFSDELQQIKDRSLAPTTLARTWAKRDAGLCLRWLYLHTAELLRRELGWIESSGSGPMPLKMPTSPLNMQEYSGHLEKIMDAQRLKDRSLNQELVFADLLMWWYGDQGLSR